jgi:hypothetical protein
MVPSNHDGTDSGSLSAGDGLLCLVPGRIDHTDQASKHEIMLNILASRRNQRRPISRGDAVSQGKRSQRFTRKVFGGFQNLRSTRFRQDGHVARDNFM